MIGINKVSVVSRVISRRPDGFSADLLTTDPNKDGRRVSTSCHYTDMEWKRPDTSGAMFFC